MIISDDDLTAALAQITPQVDGLQNIANDSLSDALLAEIQAALADFQHRQRLINDALGAIQALEADGYPAPMPPVPMSGVLLSELHADVAKVETGAAVFVPIPGTQAATMVVTLSPFADKE